MEINDENALLNPFRCDGGIEEEDHQVRTSPRVVAFVALAPYLELVIDEHEGVEKIGGNANAMTHDESTSRAGASS
ncbi:hypothetical protein ACLOJK_005854 [Asimina triloba]